MNIKEVYAYNVKKHREKLGITQAELAERLDIHLSSIARIETGKQLSNSVILENLVKVLDINYSDLFVSPEKEEDKLKNKINLDIDKLDQKGLEYFSLAIEAYVNVHQ